MKKRSRAGADAERSAEVPGRERRQHARVPVDLEVDYRCDDHFLFAYIADMSEMGIFVRTDSPHPPGTRLVLHFSPGGGAEIQVEGEVVWINPYRPGHPDSLNPGMGVQFVNLDRPTQERILALVKTFAYLDDEDSTMGHS